MYKEKETSMANDNYSENNGLNEFNHGDFYDDDRDFVWIDDLDELHTEILRRIYEMDQDELEELLEYLKQK